VVEAIGFIHVHGQLQAQERITILAAQ